MTTRCTVVTWLKYIVCGRRMRRVSKMTHDVEDFHLTSEIKTGRCFVGLRLHDAIALRSGNSQGCCSCDFRFFDTVPVRISSIDRRRQTAVAWPLSELKRSGTSTRPFQVRWCELTIASPWTWVRHRSHTKESLIRIPTANVAEAARRRRRSQNALRDLWELYPNESLQTLLNKVDCQLPRLCSVRNQTATS